MNEGRSAKLKFPPIKLHATTNTKLGYHKQPRATGQP